MDFVTMVYRLTEHFPQSELYGLTMQLRRSAVSIPSNIAEGKRRGTDKELRQFIQIAFGSGAEIETQMEIAMKLGFISEDEWQKTVEKTGEIMRMLNGLLAHASH